MRWYNPSSRAFEWRKVPASDEEALSLLKTSPETRPYVEVYQEWRELGASITASLIRVSDAAWQNTEEGHH